MKKVLGIILSVFLVLSLTLQVAAIKSVPVKSIKLDKSKITLNVGQTYSLKVTLSPSNTTQKILTYATGNKNIATIDAKGVIKGVGKGSATITVYTSNKSVYAKCNVTVSQPEPTKVKMFFGTAGIAFPSDVDKSNNPFINIIEKAANVDLIMIQPEYADFQTQFNLMMASGELPDIVHCWFKADIDKYGSEGAFINWMDYLPKSKQLSQFYTKDMLDTMKTNTGAVYALNVLSAMDPNGTYARIDLIKDLNGGVMPKTPDDWYQLFKKEKVKYPDSIPMSTQGGIMMADYFWKAFGLGGGMDGNGANLFVSANTPNKYIWAFSAAKAREAVEFHRKLYAEGLLDKTFVTNKGTEFSNAVENKNAMISWGGAAAVISRQTRMTQIANTNAVWGFVNNPIAPGVNAQDCYQSMNPVGWHCVSISKKSKVIDAAIRVIESFTLPEVKIGIAWGREGIEYVKNAQGKKILDIEESGLTNYRTVYCFFNAYWYPDNLEVLAAGVYPKCAAAQAAAFRKAYADGVKIRDAESKSVPAFTAASFVPSIPDLAPKKAEARAASLNIIFKAIIGEISMDEYDKQVKDFLDKYQYIADEYTKSLVKVIAQRGN